MKARTKNYLEREKAFRNMIAFKDLKSFLMNSFKTANSYVVKNDIVRFIENLKQPTMNSMASAS